RVDGGDRCSRHHYYGDATDELAYSLHVLPSRLKAPLQLKSFAAETPLLSALGKLRAPCLRKRSTAILLTVGRRVMSAVSCVINCGEASGLRYHWLWSGRFGHAIAPLSFHSMSTGLEACLN